MGFFERISNGWSLAMDSFDILKKNQTLLIFPVLSIISLLLIFASLIGGIYAKWGINIESIRNIDYTTRYFLLFIFYLVNYMVIVFFNMALIHCTQKILNGAKTTVRDGIMFSLSRIGAVLSWALVSATVGVILKIIENKHEKIASFVVSLFGMLWSIATFFVVPVMAYENLGVFQAIKRSTLLFKDTWGERIGANFSFSIIGFIVFVVIGLSLGLLIIAMNFAIGLTIMALTAIVVSCIFSAANTIFMAAVYQYATGKPVEGFNRLGFSDIFNT